MNEYDFDGVLIVRILANFLAMFCIFFIFSSAFAQSAGSGSGAGKKWGAIAASKKTGSFGYSVGQNSKSMARRIALKECRKHARDCKIATVSNICLAFASSKRTGSWGWARDYTKPKAAKNALNTCKKYGDAANCKLRFSVCN